MSGETSTASREQLLELEAQQVIAAAGTGLRGQFSGSLWYCNWYCKDSSWSIVFFIYIYTFIYTVICIYIYGYTCTWFHGSSWRSCGFTVYIYIYIYIYYNVFLLGCNPWCFFWEIYIYINQLEHWYSPLPTTWNASISAPREQIQYGIMNFGFVWVAFDKMFRIQRMQAITMQIE